MNNVKITLAKTAGFCFGVARAIRYCEDLAQQKIAAVTLGPIIHNPQIVQELERRGIKQVEGLSNLPKDTVVVIRSHGVEPEVYETIEKLNLRCIDASCKDVLKIHDIVKKAALEGRIVLIVGDDNHPEVVGTSGYAAGKCYVFDNEGRLLEEIFPKTGDVPAIIVAQTTFNLLQYQEYVEVAKTLYTDIEVYDTICNAMLKRQHEAALLSKENEVCIIIGGRLSSNSKKLYELCRESTKSYLIETKDELNASMFQGVRKIAVTAGASTPTVVIEEVLSRMDELIRENGDTTNELEIEEEFERSEVEEIVTEEGNEIEIQEDQQPEQSLLELPEEKTELNTQSESEQETDLAIDEEGEKTEAGEEEFSFETALEGSYRPLRRNQRVSGVVTQIRPNEIVVDIGSKQTGIIPLEELSNNPSAKPEEIVTIGEKVNLIVIKTNDVEGITTLSKKKLDSSEGLDFVTKAFEEGTVLEAYVIDLVNKGLIAIVKNIRVFVPASLATLRPGMNYDDLLRTNVRLKILEVDPSKRRVIGSIKAVLNEERNRIREAFWAEIAPDKEYTGVIKSLTDYGAFVDLGGVDGMVHVSELSWKRIRRPSDVVSVGQEITVYVKSVDYEKHRISLGFKKEEDNPWHLFESKYSIGDIFDVTIVSLTPFGAFARITDDIDGLIHVSEISSEHIANASDVLSVGDVVSVKLMSTDNEKRRVSLSMRYEGAPIIEPRINSKQEEDTVEVPEVEINEEIVISEDIVEEVVLPDEETAEETQEESVSEPEQEDLSTDTQEDQPVE